MKWANKIIASFILMAILAPVISNDKPILVLSNGHIYFPCLNDDHLFLQKNDFYIMPLIPYRAGVSDFDNADFKSPFDTQNTSFLKRHWLGTTLRGCDVLAGIISGARYALLIGFCSAVISLIVGLIIGAGSAFSNKGGIRMSIFYLLFLFTLFLFDYNLILNVHASAIIKCLVLLVSFVLILFLSKVKYKSKINVKIDISFLESQLTIMFSSIPRLFFIVAIMGIFHQGTFVLILLLGFTGWMEIARLVRADISRIQSMDYYAAAKLSGATWMRITIKQLLPNLKSLLLAVFAFSFAGAIISEASLSFLGFGLTVNQVTWGSLILEGKESFQAWWLILFPGLCLCLCLLALFSIARNGNNDHYSL